MFLLVRVWKMRGWWKKNGAGFDAVGLGERAAERRGKLTPAPMLCGWNRIWEQRRTAPDTAVVTLG